MSVPRDESFVALCITKAILLEKTSKSKEALKAYKEGIEVLMGLVKHCTSDSKKSIYRGKASDYLKRAEVLSKKIQAEEKRKQYREQKRIPLGAKGHSYEKIFGPYFTEDVRGIRVEDAYVRNHVQVLLFLRFCETAVRLCPNLVSIVLLTGHDKHKANEQKQNLEQIRESLKESNVNLVLQFSETLHDREIKLNTGWTFKIGRGLDFYKSVKNVFSIGTHDLELRECLETTIDIFHTDAVSKFT
eukprot:TRINITY_DN1158_c0_g1_i1.p1 TRINITY_DN1158_c0_g1~~TRINITY_DN1158_c0_g1_i1.p1  ORF type:complete len:245 (+),score=0.30 TRINITY_DN1158_c0_g1_i1:167-901(+)